MDELTMKIQAATLAARERTGVNYSTCVSQGKMQVVIVQYSVIKKGSSVLDKVSALMPADQIPTFLNSLN